jgi:hypothetical protein
MSYRPIGFLLVTGNIPKEEARVVLPVAVVVQVVDDLVGDQRRHHLRLAVTHRRV